MTPSAATQPPQNMSRWLLQNPVPTQSTESAIAERVRTSSSRVLAQLGQVARASLSRQVVDAFEEILPSDVVDVFRKAWGDYQALLEVGADSVRQAPTRRIMKLRDQNVRFKRESSLVVVVQNKAVLTLAGRVEVVFALGKVEAVVWSGQLLKVQVGQASLTATIHVEEQEIARKKYVWPLDAFSIEFNPTVDLVSWAYPFASPQYQM